MTAFSRTLDVLCQALLALAAALMVLIAVLILSQMLGRFVGLVVPSAVEFSGFSVAALTMLAAAPTLRAGGHIRVTLVTRLLSPAVTRWLEVLVLAIAIGLAGLLAVFITDTALRSFELGDVSPGLVALPLVLPQGAMAIGAWGLVLVLVEAFLIRMTGGVPPYARIEDTTMAMEE